MRGFGGLGGNGVSYGHDMEVIRDMKVIRRIIEMSLPNRDVGRVV